MRLANGIVIDKEATFGALKFSALRREVHLQNEDGSVSEEIKERTYDLKSRGQRKEDAFFKDLSSSRSKETMKTTASTLTQSITIWGIFSFWYHRNWKKGCCWN